MRENYPAKAETVSKLIKKLILLLEQGEGERTRGAALARFGGSGNGCRAECANVPEIRECCCQGLAGCESRQTGQLISVLHTLLYQQREAHICRVSPTGSFSFFLLLVQVLSGSSAALVLCLQCPRAAQAPARRPVLPYLALLFSLASRPANAELSMPQSRVPQSWKGSLCATLPGSHGSNAEEQRELRVYKLIWQSTTLCFPRCSQAKAHRELFTLLHP